MNWQRTAFVTLTLGGGVSLEGSALARPNTHAPAISTWDTRASTVVLGVGRAVSGSGDFTRLSYNANFSSTTGVLSAQFGVHYLTYRDRDDSVLARGFSAGGVALFNFPIASRFTNGVPRSSFDFYVGGVPTALFSGQLNFISLPLVLGAGVPISPVPWLSIEPWVELSPGLNFDTRIEEVSTAEAVQSAMDGTLTRAEVESLVEQGLKISQETTLGKRAGLSLTGHLGERVDLSAHLAFGAGHSGSASLGASLVVRWDAMVVGGAAPSAREAARREADAAETEVPSVCRQWQAGLRRCMAAPPQRRGVQPLRAPTNKQSAPGRRRPVRRPPAAAPVPRSQSPVRSPGQAPAARPAVPPLAPVQPAAVQPAAVQPAAVQPTKKKAAPPAAPLGPTPAGAKPVPALPPLQSAPPVQR